MPALDRIAWVVPRVAARMPFRSDCLVQALAAQAMLSRRGIASRVHLGARKGPGGGIEAHAWLTAGGRTVTGGRIDGYAEFS